MEAGEANHKTVCVSARRLLRHSPIRWGYLALAPHCMVSVLHYKHAMHYV